MEGRDEEERKEEEQEPAAEEGDTGMVCTSTRVFVCAVRVCVWVRVCVRACACCWFCRCWSVRINAMAHRSTLTRLFAAPNPQSADKTEAPQTDDQMQLDEAPEANVVCVYVCEVLVGGWVCAREMFVMDVFVPALCAFHAVLCPTGSVQIGPLIPITLRHAGAKGVTAAAGQRAAARGAGAAGRPVHGQRRHAGQRGQRRGPGCGMGGPSRVWLWRVERWLVLVCSLYLIWRPQVQQAPSRSRAEENEREWSRAESQSQEAEKKGREERFKNRNDANPLRNLGNALDKWKDRLRVMELQEEDSQQQQQKAEVGGGFAGRSADRFVRAVGIFLFLLRKQMSWLGFLLCGALT